MNLAIDFLGKRFETPFVLASAPPTGNTDMMARAFESGWAGAVIKTLIREPVRNVQNRFAANKLGKRIFAFENVELLSEKPPEEWYRDISRLKERFPTKIVIGSIMGDAKSQDQWLELALGCQDAGVDFVELNFSCPHGYPEKGKGAAIGQSAEFSSRIVKWLKGEKRITVPIIAKLTAAVADISYIGEAVANAGADGICAINTFPAIMGFDLKTLKPRPSVGGYTTAGGYSGPGLKPIALRCVSDLVKNPGLPVMGCGGVSSGYDAAEFILIGAPIVQVCTAVMLKGYSVVSKMQKQLEEFMGWHDFSAVEDFLGLGSKRVRQFSELDQGYVVKAHVDSDKCNGCEICVVSCRDAAYQAIEMRDDLATIDHDKCKGCSLCFHICPVGAVSMVEI
jgi:dihydropyrimidine dehydrogenase (NAD+) subunit PreA